jgi:hypothetical protein
VGFDPEDIERMTPAVRTELQERIARLYLKAQTFKASGQPERRHPRRAARWPHTQPWPTTAGGRRA